MKDLTLCAARMRMIRGETQYNSVSRFIKEIPGKLMDNRPVSKPKKDISYREDSTERLFFKSKPFGGGQENSSIFKTNSNIGNRTKETSFLSTGMGAVRSSNTIAQKPKAVIKQQTTATENKPFITKGLVGNGVSKGVPTSQGLGYCEGDRVKHIKYGAGTVKKIEAGTRDYQVTVDFDGAGQKVMYAAFAKLRKL